MMKLPSFGFGPRFVRAGNKPSLHVSCCPATAILIGSSHADGRRAFSNVHRQVETSDLAK
jgi:hypothetical protein